MLVLITYDVNTETAAGKARLRKVAKQCVTLKAALANIIDEKTDSLRFYYLGNNYKSKIEHMGIERGISADDMLIL